MSENVIEFTDRGTLEQEAGAWLIRLDSEEALTREEQAALREWYARSPAHREELKNLAAFWGKMNILTDLAVPLGSAQEAQHRRRGGHNFRLWSLGSVTAFATIAAFVALGVWLARDPFADTNGLYSTAVGQQQTATLADGSVIQLNTNTRLQVEFGDDYRDIRLLQGEAYFTVAKNPQRPFRVHAGKGRVQAVGTAFSVYLKDSAIDVVVTEGRVSLAALLEGRQSDAARPAEPSVRSRSSDTDTPPGRAPDDSMVTERDLGILDAGQGASIQLADSDSSADDADSGSNSTPGEPQDILRLIDAATFSQQLAWRNGLIIFTGQPLEQVVHEISRYTPVTIEITDPDVKAIKIGGQFRVGDTDAMFASLEANFGLQIKRLGPDHLQIAAAE